ncbi:MAG TPA: S9 family peptidase [Bryobacteraceae bacterium]|nr:S9 family peptidase [Bryobacteraceae bacterium]
MRNLSGLFVAVILASGIEAASQSLTIEKLIDIKHPSDPIWSPDGRHVVFVWDRAGVSNLYVADASGRSAPTALTNFSEGPVSGAFWSHDSKFIYFPHHGDLWQASASGGEARAVWTTPPAEANIAISPDGKQVAFVRTGESAGSDLLVRSLVTAKETHLVHDDAGLGAIAWSPDGSRISYSAGARSIRHEEAPGYSGSKIIYTITERTPGQLFVIPASGGKPVSLKTPIGFEGARWLDATHVIFDRQSGDFKKRIILVADVVSGAVHPLHEDVEDQFWSVPGNSGSASQPSPDGRWIAFLSDVDGWDHLYVSPAAGGEPVQITKGKFEAWRPVWSHDGKKIAFDANEPDRPGDRRLGIADLSAGPSAAKITYITRGRGTNIAPLWSMDDSRLVYQHTDLQNSADLFTIDAKAGATPRRLTDSMPAGVDRSAFVEPEYVHFPGADGSPVPGWLFVPKNLDRTKKHAAIVWIHGDGINQNYDGWHVQRNYAVYYSFHQYLLQQGYVVFAPDYRGSIGYGRAWRNGVFMDVGGKDAKDAWMSANYLKTLPYVDPERIGVWGLSYGGFFTLIAMTDQPTLFRAGVDVAGVVDYAMYYTDPYHGSWTASRIGTPEQNPRVYANASPVSHIDKLARPLLVLHGTADVNVPYLESVRLIDEVLKQNKGDLVSFMVYPGEFHYFTRAQVLRDAWRRVDDFFNSNLHPSAP